MNDDLPIQKLFHPFREAKAPPGFAGKVMAQIRSDKVPVGRTPKSFGRWAWAGGLALAASVVLMVSRNQAPPPISTADVSFYLGESTDLEEDANLGTEIERYFL